MTTAHEMRRKYLADSYAQARAAFARHELAEEGPGRWVLRRRYADGKGFESTYWTEVACMAGGYLYVNGDIDLVVFAYGPADPVSRVAWMAKASDGYAAEKVAIGMTAPRGCSMAHDWEHDIAVQAVREALTADGEDEPEVSLPKDFDSVDEAIESLGLVDSTEQAFAEWLHEHFEFDDCEGLWDAGRVLSSRVIYAQAALARLLQLIEARESAPAVAEVARG